MAWLLAIILQIVHDIYFVRMEPKSIQKWPDSKVGKVEQAENP